MEFIYAFLVGGGFCVIGQLLLDRTKMTPAHVMATFVVSGVILEGFGVYEQLIEFAGAGATIPITSLGYSLIHSEMQGTSNMGPGMGMVDLTSVSLSITILFSFLAALIFKPKG
ncbi:stage V sporulation protein AE [Microbacteriaceae bacterium 4G12]